MTASLNPYISQFGEEFDAEKSSQYRMTIQYALGGLSYALLDDKAQTLIALECYQSELLADNNDLFRCLERALEAKGLNNKAFQSVTSIIDERTNMLVPEPLYQSDSNEKLLSFRFNLPRNHAIIAERLERHKAFNVFAFSKTLHSKTKAKWPELHIVHSSSVFLKSLPQSETPTVYLNVRNRDFDMAIMDDKLLFYNNFKFNTKDDFAYFLLFAMNQCGLSGDDTPVCFSGLILPTSEIIDRCSRYIKTIRFVEDPHTFRVSDRLDEVPYQYYFTHYQALR